MNKNAHSSLFLLTFNSIQNYQKKLKISNFVFLITNEFEHFHIHFSSHCCILCSCCSSVTQFSSVQSLKVSHLCDPLNRSTLDLPVHHQLPEFTQTHSIQSVMPSSHLILCRPFLLLPPIPPSIRVFSKESALPMRWLDGITDWMEWVWVNSGSWWWTGRSSVLRFKGSQRW